MKNIIVILASFAFFFKADAQQLKESAVPTPVKIKFASLYPGIKNVKWDKEDGNYEADFKQNITNVAVLLDPSGNLIQTETEIAVSSLPQKILDYASKNIAGKKIKEATKIIDASGTVTYEAEVGEVDYLFDVNGNFIRMETDETDDDEDNE